DNIAKVVTVFDAFLPAGGVLHFHGTVLGRRGLVAEVGVAVGRGELGEEIGIGRVLVSKRRHDVHRVGDRREAACAVVGHGGGAPEGIADAGDAIRIGRVVVIQQTYLAERIGDGDEAVGTIVG